MKISYKLVLALLFLISCESKEKVSEDLANKFLEEGNAAFKNKEITTAIKKLELAAYYAENSNQKEGITYNLAYTYYLSSDYERALDILNGLTIKRRVLFLKGLCLYNLAMFNSSIEVFNEAKALNSDKNNHDLKIWIANGYSGLQQYGKAIEILLEVIESADNEANKYHALQNLGYVYLHTRQYDEAIEILSQAIELEKDLMSQINLADAYRLKGDIKKARMLTNELLSRNDLSIREVDMLQVLDMELRGLDASYLRKKLEQPDPLAVVTRAQAAHGADMAQATLHQHYERQQAAQLRQRIVVGGILLVLLCIGLWYAQRRRSQMYQARLREFESREPDIQKLFSLLENPPRFSDYHGSDTTPNGDQ